MSQTARHLTILTLLLALAAAPAAPILPPSEKDIADWVRQLGARDFATRERAQKKLWQAGQAAEEALKKAVNGDDAEVRRRAAALLAKFKWGIYPDTPKDIVALIGQYQAGNPQTKLTIVRRLFDKGGAGFKALLKIATAEDNEQIRRQLYQQISQDAGRAIPQMVAENNYAMLEKLLELTLNNNREAALPNYAAYWLLRGKIDERIAHYRKLIAPMLEGNGALPKYHETLFYLLRAKGDLAGARKVAETANRKDLLGGLLEENRMWKEVAATGFTPEDRREIELLGYRAAYHRLAGNKKEFEAAIAEIKKYAEGKDPAGQEAWHSAKALFLNDRPDEALALLGKNWTAQTKCTILAAQMKFAEALALAEKAKREPNANAGSLDVFRARILYFLGEKEQAQKLFASLAEQIRPGNDLSWFDELIHWEVRLGLREQAFEHCAKALTVSTSPLAQERLLRRLFPGQETTARVWWNVLRKKQASEKPSVTMKGLRSLMAGKVKGKELTTLVNESLTELGNRIEGMPQAAPTSQLTDTGKQLQALGEGALIGGEEELAKRCFEKAAEACKYADAMVRWGDVLAGKKQWREAAEAYGKAWEIDRRKPLPLYLHGWALTQAGQKEEGKKLIEQAHWLPLGNEHIRAAFARELVRRDHDEASKRERKILLRTCPLGSYQAGDAWRLDGIAAYRAKDYRKAADYHELAMLRVLRTHVNFLDTAAYVAVPHMVHRMRARGLAAAGKFDEALREVDLCLAAVPNNVEMAVQLVPALEKGGRKKEADALFVRVRKINEELSAKYPDSAGLHNSVAWLCAACKRDLKEAQKRAEKATKLAPKNPGYRDTLAEALFQLGQKEQAIAQMKKCIEMDPKRDYYRLQLARFEAGDPKAELPPEN